MIPLYYFATVIILIFINALYYICISKLKKPSNPQNYPILNLTKDLCLYTRNKGSIIIHDTLTSFPTELIDIILVYASIYRADWNQPYNIPKYIQKWYDKKVLSKLSYKYSHIDIYGNNSNKFLSEYFLAWLLVITEIKHKQIDKPCTIMLINTENESSLLTEHPQHDKTIILKFLNKLNRELYKTRKTLREPWMNQMEFPKLVDGYTLTIANHFKIITGELKDYIHLQQTKSELDYVLLLNSYENSTSFKQFCNQITTPIIIYPVILET